MPSQHREEKKYRQLQEEYEILKINHYYDMLTCLFFGGAMGACAAAFILMN